MGETKEAAGGKKRKKVGKIFRTQGKSEFP
jgi:hypothetical protein